jgi:hypothetical protein
VRQHRRLRRLKERLPAPTGCLACQDRGGLDRVGLRAGTTRAKTLASQSSDTSCAPCGRFDVDLSGGTASGEASSPTSSPTLPQLLRCVVDEPLLNGDCPDALPHLMHRGVHQVNGCRATAKIGGTDNWKLTSGCPNDPIYSGRSACREHSHPKRRHYIGVLHRCVLPLVVLAAAAPP